MAAAQTLPEVGQVIQLNAEDYMYGRGPIKLSVAMVGEPFKMDDIIWVRISGYRVHPEPHPWGPLNTFSVKVSRIRLVPPPGEPLPQREAAPG